MAIINKWLKSQLQKLQKPPRLLKRSNHNIPQQQGNIERIQLEIHFLVNVFRFCFG